MRSTGVVRLSSRFAAMWLAVGATAALCDSGTRDVTFTRSIVNLESYRGSLQADPPPVVRRGLDKGGRLLYGEIFRQLPGDPPTSRAHDVPFAVRIEGGTVVRAWVDANLNGDLTDDPEPALFPYPGDPRARSFLTTLRWSIAAPRPMSIERLVRVVVEPPDAEGVAPDYQLQDVYGMLGSVEIEGVSRRALLFDANHDGLYTRGHGDGVFFDLDGDRHFVIDPLASNFGPFAIPFSILHTSLSVDSVEVDGSRMAMRARGAASIPELPRRGRLAPDFTFVDLDGKVQRLSAHRGRPTVVYFWASWCANCRGQAEALRALRARPSAARWDLLGICSDTERADAIRFCDEHRETWPTSFSGGYVSEDPVARLYREPMVGIFYVIGPSGILVDKVADVDAMQAALDKCLAAGLETAPVR